MAKHSKMEALRGRRIELRNLLRRRIYFGGTQEPLPPIQKIGVLFVSLMLLAIAAGMVGVSIFLAYREADRIGRPWGIAVFLAMTVLIFFFCVGLLNLASGKIRRTAAEMPPKY